MSSPAEKFVMPRLIHLAVEGWPGNFQVRNLVLSPANPVERSSPADDHVERGGSSRVPDPRSRNQLIC